jgi:dienelactone hydrolase
MLKSPVVITQAIDMSDSLRNRVIPALIYSDKADTGGNHKLVIISAGYLGQNTEYSFLANHLVKEGYKVVVIRHELPTDEPIAREGNLYELRMPNWERSVKNVQFVIEAMKKIYPSIRCNKPILIGHSNGGDISILFSKLYPESLSAVITLDHRRMPIPRSSTPRILSIRADQFEADPGVLPGEEEQKKYGIQIIQLKNTRHDDLCDLGNPVAKQKVDSVVMRFLSK